MAVTKFLLSSIQNRPLIIKNLSHAKGILEGYGCKERLTWKKAKKVGNYKIQTHKIVTN